MCLDKGSLARREESGGHGECMDVLRIPRQHQSKSLAPRSVPSTSILLSLPVFTHPGTVHSPRPYVSLRSSCRRGKTPNQLASEPISRSAGQSALQRALPIIIWFFSCCSVGVFPLHKCHDVPAGVKAIHTFQGP